MHRAAVAALGLTLLLAGCGTTGSTPATPGGNASTTAQTNSAAAKVVDATGGAATTTPPAVHDPILQTYGLDGRTVVDIVEGMDVTNAHRGSGLNGSVRADHLLLKDEKAGTEVSVPMPKDRFYASVAPYVSTTHECFNHSLTGCKGEFAGGTQLQAEIKKDDGTVLYQGPVTTFENGFVSFWLPRGVRGTMSFSYDGKQVSAPFATDADSPTCITTMQLT